MSKSAPSRLGALNVALNVALFLAAGFASSSRATPTEAPAPALELTLHDALGRLRATSPFARVLAAEVARVRAGRVNAGLLENPTLDYGGLSLLAGANTGALYQHELMVSQALPLSGQRRARVAVVDRAVDHAEAEAGATLLTRAHELRLAFIAQLEATARAEVLITATRALEDLIALARLRAEAGAEGRFDVARLTLEVRQLEVALQVAQVEEVAASRELAALIGASGAMVKAKGRLPSEGPACTVERGLAEAEARHPALEAARRAEALGQAELDLARRERLPVPTFSVGAALTHQQDSGLAQFAVSVPLPLHDRGQGAIAEVSAANLARAAAQAALRAELAAALRKGHEAAVRLHAALVAHRGEVMAPLPELVGTAREAWRAGLASTLDLIELARAQREAALTELSLQRQLGEALAELASATGSETCLSP
jgi:cobalt-zinc-cadmium efflux system outer membrane protein